MLKKLAIVFGALVALLVIAAVVAPMVVDVDKYRPQAVQAVNEHLNGKLTLGKLSLSLWGQIRVEVAGVTLTDAAGRQVVSVKDAFFHLPFLPLLTGSPVVTFKMQKPSVNVVKDRTGKLNVMSLMKSEAPVPGKPGAATAQAAKPSSQAPTSAPTSLALPGIATRARIGVELLGANVSYKDLGTGLESKVNDLNFILKDISLSHPTEIEISANLDTTMGETLKVKGPMLLTGTATPTVQDGKLGPISLAAKLNLDGLDIQSGDLFHKSGGMAANADLAVSYSEKEARVEKLVAKFFNAELQVSGAVSNGPDQSINFSVKSNEIDLKAWNQLVPMLKEYDLAGKAGLEAQVNGPVAKFTYHAKFRVDGLTAKAPSLKTEPRVDLAVDVVTDQVDQFNLTMKAPGNDIAVKGKVVSFTKPHVDFDVTSSGMDLDQLLVESKSTPSSKGGAATTASTAGGAPSGGGAKGSAPANSTAAGEGYDKMVDSLRTNKMAADTVATVGFNFKELKTNGVQITDLSGKLIFRDLIAGLSQFSMKLWSGQIKSDFSTELKPKIPTYKFSTSVDGLDLAQAADSQMHMFKNTVTGKAHFSIAGSGASFNPAPATVALNAKGSFKIDDAKFATMDIGKIATDAVNKGLAGVAQKVPQLGGKTLNAPASVEGGYESVSSDFTVAGGKFSAPNFFAKAKPNQGIDIKGATTVSLVDYSLAADWQIVDTYNLMQTKFDVDVAGAHIPHVLAEGNNPVTLPIHVGGTCSSPVVSYTQVPAYLTGVAAKNVEVAVSGAARSKVQDAIKNAIPPSAAPAVQNALKKFGF